MSALRFDSRVVLITGAAGAIGSETAVLLRELGASLCLTDVSSDGLEATRSRVDVDHKDALCSSADLSRVEEVDVLVDRCLEHFGQLDVVINAAGIYPEALIEAISEAEWRRVMQINLDSVFYVCQKAAPLLSTGGAIVNLTSIAAHRGSFGHGHYAASKAAVLALSRTLATEYAPRVRVNCLSPGPVDTPMVRDLMRTSGSQILANTPMKRICKVREVAQSLAFLASDWSSFITGETLHINGGQYIYG
ncbi:SDR family oxidoreductase (plasmid) [Cupriavidus pinatubonensis]|uniref:SDR family NAD(P)-dependent oxidoreductase n=1 Tax=Cupriavidus pinatubonensis TaxID=248026 RepID=UPI001C736FC6|nr:SDR family NAD(P)-dependent oxidoreductase [Cupriavidus pinatubonensis]QYY33790.1 SDR family oxidoreductase [Cupriavidus pinatubonensis]